MIRQIFYNKKQFLELLLLGDEQESMIDRYLEQGDLFLWEKEGQNIAVAVVTDEGESCCELKNLAVAPSFQRKGYGRAMLDFLYAHYKGRFTYMQLGTGDSPLTLPFYEASGFMKTHCIPNFFIDNYDHPIWEGGKQLVDMIYLRKEL